MHEYYVMVFAVLAVLILVVHAMHEYFSGRQSDSRADDYDYDAQSWNINEMRKQQRDDKGRFLPVWGK